MGEELNLPVNTSQGTAMIHTSLALPTPLGTCNYLAFTASATKLLWARNKAGNARPEKSLVWR